mmetsp:Transcript_16590/g.41974  ORF Transcript_16590/g.41974 Transcript_16590/m.41974 type:complete len:208 (+) Transcript_16590:632-1255(+)
MPADGQDHREEDVHRPGYLEKQDDAHDIQREERLASAQGGRRRGQGRAHGGGQGRGPQGELRALSAAHDGADTQGRGGGGPLPAGQGPRGAAGAALQVRAQGLPPRGHRGEELGQVRRRGRGGHREAPRVGGAQRADEHGSGGALPQRLACPAAPQGHRGQRRRRHPAHRLRGGLARLAGRQGALRDRPCARQPKDGEPAHPGATAG